ncbi:alpha/beta hydrolase family protein [Alkalicaulis satelles]|nr:prolyl oligopeptidase family serine peptidase [Alkalicaulis satelles]
MRSGPANWAPHTGLRLYETAATQTGLFALSRGAGHVLVQEIEADSINWTLFDPFSGPRPVDLPAGPVFASHEGRVLFDANPGGDAATFGLMPGHCITNGCEDSEIIHFAPLTPDRQTPALSLGGDGRLFMIRWEDGASVLYSAPAEPGGAFSKVGGAPQGVHLQFEVLAGFSGVGLSAQAPAGDRRWIHLEIRDGETFIHDLALQPSWFEVRTSSGRAQSADGQAIPYTLFEPLEPASDPCAPLLVHVYGGYGAPSQPRPLFGAERQWIENGGRVAIAHVRGDGAFGAEWAALGESDRWRTIEDLLGVIRHFHEAGLAAPSSTLITGGSFGGALVLAAAAHAPDRIAGADAGSPPLRGGTLDESLTAYLALDPPLQGRLEGMPVLIRAGSHDRVTSPDDLQAWRAILSRNGAEVTALIFDGLPHEWRGSDHPAGHAAEARIASWMLERVTPETACMP